MVSLKKGHLIPYCIKDSSFSFQGEDALLYLCSEIKQFLLKEISFWWHESDNGKSAPSSGQECIPNLHQQEVSPWQQVTYLVILFSSATLAPSCCCCCWVASDVSDSLRPHRQQPTRLRRPWDSPGKNTGEGCHCLLQYMKVKSKNEVAQSCPTLCDPRDGSPPGSSVHGICQARVLEWGAIAFSRIVSLRS